MCAADQIRWEQEVEVYEKTYPHYRSYLAQKHVKKLNDKGVIDIQLAQLGIKKPLNSRHFYIKEQVEVDLLTAHALPVYCTKHNMVSLMSYNRAAAY